MTGLDASGPQAIGFAGLSSLATKLPPEPRFDPHPEKPAVEKNGTSPAPLDAQTVPNPRFWTGQRRWYVTLAVGVVAVIGIANWPRDPTPYRAPSSSGTYSPTPAYVPPAVPQDPYAESKPTIGTGQTLSRNEIRYCLSERVRVEAVGNYVDTTKQSHIDRYNTMVDDYNGRCSNYRYRQSDMSAVKAAVDLSGDRLKAQAAATVRQWR